MLSSTNGDLMLKTARLPSEASLLIASWELRHQPCVLPASLFARNYFTHLTDFMTSAVALFAAAGAWPQHHQLRQLGLLLNLLLDLVARYWNNSHTSTA